MSRIGVLALALAAIAALFATSATSASAAQVFHSASAPVKVTTTADGTGKNSHHVLDAAGGSVTCTGFTGEAEQNSTDATSIAFSSVAYSNCTFLGQAATVSMNECTYVLQAAGTLDISCPAGKEITISTTLVPCDVKVPPQTGLSNVSYSNIASSTEVTASPSVTGVKYTASGPGCPLTGSFTNGNYTTGNVILTAEQPFTSTMVALRTEECSGECSTMELAFSSEVLTKNVGNKWKVQVRNPNAFEIEVEEDASTNEAILKRVGVNCKGEKLKANESCEKRELECVGKGIATWTVQISGGGQTKKFARTYECD